MAERTGNQRKADAVPYDDLHDELAKAWDALGACQEELARASTLVDYHQALAEGAEGELARVQQEAKIEVVSAEDRALTARATRDELAQAILAPDGVEAIRLARAALSSEATKGDAE